MNNDDGIILQMQEDGTWGIKEEPYCTVELQTKEDYEKLQKALEKQTPKKIKVQEGTNYTDGEPYNILTCTECDCEISDAFEWEDIDDDEKIKKFAEGIEIEYFQFCIKCGQKLDWRVEE